MDKFNDQPMLFAFGVNHKTAPIEVREKLYVHEREIPALVARLRETLDECFVLSTCNRTEIYAVAGSSAINLEFYRNLLIEFKDAGEIARPEYFFTFVSCAACRQLFDVATSVDSKIIGDTQILQQLRAAYSAAAERGATGKILNQLAQRSFKIGKKVYTETSIHKGAISISLAAVELALETFGSLRDKSVMIIGAGETARLTAECLIKKNVGKILITNRTSVNAAELLEDLHKAHDFRGEAVNFGNFKSHLNETDIVISSTSAPGHILEAEDFDRQTNKILLIDIAIPRDIAPESAENPNVVLKNIDDLHAIVDKNFERRMADLPRVKRIITEEMSDFLLWYYALPLLPEMESVGAKPDKPTVAEIVRVREFLLSNASLFHKLARDNSGDAETDLRHHVDLIRRLQTLKRETFGAVNA